MDYLSSLELNIIPYSLISLLLFIAPLSLYALTFKYFFKKDDCSLPRSEKILASLFIGSVLSILYFLLDLFLRGSGLVSGCSEWCGFELFFFAGFAGCIGLIAFITLLIKILFKKRNIEIDNEINDGLETPKMDRYIIYVTSLIVLVELIISLQFSDILYIAKNHELIGMSLFGTPIGILFELIIGPIGANFDLIFFASLVLFFKKSPTLVRPMMYVAILFSFFYYTELDFIFYNFYNPRLYLFLLPKIILVYFLYKNTKALSDDISITDIKLGKYKNLALVMISLLIIMSTMVYATIFTKEKSRQDAILKMVEVEIETQKAEKNYPKISEKKVARIPFKDDTHNLVKDLENSKTKDRIIQYIKSRYSYVDVVCEDTKIKIGNEYSVSQNIIEKNKNYIKMGKKLNIPDEIDPILKQISTEFERFYNKDSDTKEPFVRTKMNPSYKENIKEVVKSSIHNIYLEQNIINKMEVLFSQPLYNNEFQKLYEVMNASMQLSDIVYEEFGKDVHAIKYGQSAFERGGENKAYYCDIKNGFKGFDDCIIYHGSNNLDSKICFTNNQLSYFHLAHFDTEYYTENGYPFKVEKTYQNTLSKNATDEEGAEQKVADTTNDDLVNIIDMSIWETYNSKEYGYQIKYPNTWVYEEKNRPTSSEKDGKYVHFVNNKGNYMLGIDTPIRETGSEGLGTIKTEKLAISGSDKFLEKNYFKEYKVDDTTHELLDEFDDKLGIGVTVTWNTNWDVDDYLDSGEMHTMRFKDYNDPNLKIFNKIISTFKFIE